MWYAWLEYIGERIINEVCTFISCRLAKVNVKVIYKHPFVLSGTIYSERIFVYTRIYSRWKQLAYELFTQKLIVMPLYSLDYDDLWISNSRLNFVPFCVVPMASVFAVFEY